MFKLLIAVFLVIGHSYGAHETFKPARGRILNGTAAEQGEFPFAASLRYPWYNNAHQCGVSILNKNFVMTSGRCVDCYEGYSLSVPEDFNIQYGLVEITTDNNNTVDLKEIHCHNFTEIAEGRYFETLFDIALLELATPLPDDGSWAPVTLARTFNSTVQQEGVVIGWGFIDNEYTETNVLQKLTMDVYDDADCGAATRDHWDHHVCLGSIGGYGGPCSGDHGSAAIVDGMQVGLNAYTTMSLILCGYDNATYPQVYTRMEKYFDWIVNITPDVQSN